MRRLTLRKSFYPCFIHSGQFHPLASSEEDTTILETQPSILFCGEQSASEAKRTPGGGSACLAPTNAADKHPSTINRRHSSIHKVSSPNLTPNKSQGRPLAVLPLATSLTSILSKFIGILVHPLSQPVHYEENAGSCCRWL